MKRQSAGIDAARVVPRRVRRHRCARRPPVSVARLCKGHCGCGGRHGAGATDHPKRRIGARCNGPRAYSRCHRNWQARGRLRDRDARLRPVHAILADIARQGSAIRHRLRPTDARSPAFSQGNAGAFPYRGREHTLRRAHVFLRVDKQGRGTLRIVIAVCLALLVAACGGNEPSVPANPVAPAPPSAPTVPTLTLSGTVSEDGHPIANAGVDVYGEQSCSSGCTSRQFNAGSGTTDAAGRYSIVIRRPEERTATVWAVAHKNGYVQQCVASATIQAADASLDLRLTSMANLSAARPQSGPGSRTVSGAVFEATPTGRPPVEGASVGWEGLFDVVVAETRSDAAGRYLLCGLPLERIPGLFALKQGYGSVSYVSVEPGGDANVDIAVQRR